MRDAFCNRFTYEEVEKEFKKKKTRNAIAKKDKVGGTMMTLANLVSKIVFLKESLSFLSKKRIQIIEFYIYTYSFFFFKIISMENTFGIAD